uniref:DNA repair protein RAD51 homolog 3 n=1 Tax=Lingulaulax polyedra TaxID=160621 RepID=A0A516AGF2_LINPO|nr:DNA repair protein RAD51-like protein 3 [Lingulodinium polyedra]
MAQPAAQPEEPKEAEPRAEPPAGRQEALDVRVLRSIPTPVADALLAQGCRSAGDVLARPGALQEALRQLHVAGAEQRAEAALAACRREVSGAWASADSALELLQRAQARPPLALPCEGLARLLGGALRPGGGFLELCGLPGTGKTQLCMQLCAAAQVPLAAGPGADGFPGEAVYIDTEGSFVPRRYAQVCRGLLAERRPGAAANPAAAAAEFEAVLRGLHICRAFDATELYATVKQLEAFLRARPRVRAIVLDSIAFCFRHEFADNIPQRARVLTDIAATLRRYGAEHELSIVITNHMTTRFDRSGGEGGMGWLAPALGETWAHQPSTQLRLERVQHGDGPQQALGRATLTKSVEQAAGRSCAYRITEVGIRDAGPVRHEALVAYGA